jgi:hypothetical protein
MHARVRCCNFHHRSIICADLRNLLANAYSSTMEPWEFTFCLIFASHWVEAFGNVLQLDIMSRSMANHDGLDQTIHVLGFWCKHSDWAAA